MRKLSLSMMAWVCMAGGAAAADLNQAHEIDLDATQGIGPALTRRILNERGKGAFANWADLLTRVKGVGPSQAQRLSAQGWTLGGAPFQAPAPATGKAGKSAGAPLAAAPAAPASVTDRLPVAP